MQEKYRIEILLLIFLVINLYPVATHSESYTIPNIEAYRDVYYNKAEYWPIEDYPYLYTFFTREFKGCCHANSGLQICLYYSDCGYPSLVDSPHNEENKLVAMSELVEFSYNNGGDWEWWEFIKYCNPVPAIRRYALSKGYNFTSKYFEYEDHFNINRDIFKNEIKNDRPIQFILMGKEIDIGGEVIDDFRHSTMAVGYREEEGVFKYTLYTGWPSEYYNQMELTRGIDDTRYYEKAMILIIPPDDLANQSPTKPILSSPYSSPSNNESGVDPTNITFQWNPSTDPDGDLIRYCITVKEDSSPEDIPVFLGCDNEDFTSPFSLDQTSYTLPISLEYGRKYWWAVWAKDSQGNWSEASEWWSFTTIVNLNNGLVAYYPFNGNANDESGNGHNGIVNGPTLTKDRFGNANSAYSFDGVDDYIELSPIFSNDQDPLTYSIWIKFDSTEYTRILFGEFTGCYVRNGFYRGANGTLHFDQYPPDSTSGIVNADLKSEIGNWVHVVLVKNDDTVYAYKNGILIDCVSHTETYSDGAPITAGIGKRLCDNWNFSSYIWKGQIDDFRIYNRALSEVEIEALYNYKELHSQPGPEDGQDVWITSTYSYDDNYGVDNEELRVGGWGDQYCTLIEFNLEGLPKSTTSAKIHLYAHPFSDTRFSSVSMYLDRATSAWDEDVGWYNRPSFIKIGDLPAPQDNFWYVIDITNLYNQWQDGTYANYGVQLRPTSTSAKMSSFYSSDYTTDPSLRPKLIVTTNGEEARKILDDTKLSLSSDVELRLETLDFIDLGSTIDYEVAVSTPRTLLELIVNWGGSVMKVEVFRPDGSFYGEFQSENPPITINISDPEVGIWKCKVTAIEVPYNNYPIALVAGIAPNKAPIADAGGSYTGFVGSSITFDASASYDEEGEIISYEWDWDNDGIYDESTTSATITHTWDMAFTGNIGLKVIDNEGLASSDSVYIEVKVPIPGDIDRDGDVDKNDLNILLSHRGQSASVCPDCDLDGDGMITALDSRKLVLLCTCPRCVCP